MKLLPFTARFAVFGSALALLAGTAAYADGTDAGTSVENTFVLTFDVGGAPQGAITNDPTYVETDPLRPSAVIDPNGPTDFTVDRLIDLILTATNAGLSVPPNIDDRILTFTVTNLGNDYQSYSFDVIDVTGGPTEFAHTGTVLTYSRGAYDLNDDGDTADTCEAAITDAPLTEVLKTDDTVAGAGEFTCDIPPDVPFTVSLSGDIPAALSEGDTDNLILHARTRNPTAWKVDAAVPTAGAVTAEDTDGNDSDLSVIEAVFADGTGSAEDTATDGSYSIASNYVVISPDLTAEKSVIVLAMDSDASDCGTVTRPLPGVSDPNAYTTPDACIEYRITVTNTGETAGSDAEGIEIVDILPSDVAFVEADWVGFTGTAPTLTYKQSDNTTDCDGSEDGSPETCTITLSGGSLAATVGATDTVATLYIRALVR